MASLTSRRKSITTFFSALVSSPKSSGAQRGDAVLDPLHNGKQPGSSRRFSLEKPNPLAAEGLPVERTQSGPRTCLLSPPHAAEGLTMERTQSGPRTRLPGTSDASGRRKLRAEKVGGKKHQTPAAAENPKLCSDFAKQTVDSLLHTTKAHRSSHAFARRHSSFVPEVEFVQTKDIIRRRPSGVDESIRSSQSLQDFVEGTKTSRPTLPRRCSLPLEDVFMMTKS
ncbi:hypothetical protein T484DRAFT_1933478 [Baffinella frigidus]|nr:hypothetical protein T484DRAFT_1933478 [Cryptophyta sp. CCMP2293]